MSKPRCGREESIMPRSVVVSESRFVDDMTICEGSREAAVKSFCAVRDRAAKEGNLMVSERQTKIMVMNSEEISKSIEIAGMDLERVYGAETWTMYASDLESLEAFQNNCLRRILRSSWMDYITGVEVRRRCCGQPTMEEILRGRKLQWVGHMQRMGRERLPKTMLWGRIDMGVSEDKVGRQRLGGMV